ncbi:penicillin-binding protein 2 [Filobacillus milosensis]|uniref:serine-type D-Ala-D-Ala carboxypeptidase n=1 Tax=Filobacillus milosensis TaxID=94137 RepID=A0A4Y8IUG0_9BACI|nr:penicillin-binding protein 2 [Filobacillus milosensis]TFB24816.1 penicillin-binding protein 2 [Filobacillus milosensis]
MTNKKKQKSHLPLRLNVLFFAIFLLFSVLILQLGVVQILYGEDAQAEIDRTENVTSKIPVPRGEIYDRYGNVVVDNELKYAITYTPQRNVQPEDNLEIAEMLTEYMTMNPESVTKRDIKDYLILKDRQKAYSRLTNEEKNLPNSEQYSLVLDRIPDTEINSLSEKELQIIAIKRELDQATQLTPHVIKSGSGKADKSENKYALTKKEYAVIAEHANQLPGINVATDWDRKKPFTPTLNSLIGNVTSSQSGLPREKLNYYLSRNYKLNDRVGENGIEEEYETYLQGQKEVRKHITNSSGEVIRSELVRQGERGKDLMLSIDMELQKRIDKILQEELKKVIEENPNENKHLNKALAVMMDPNTGEVLAMSGQVYHRADEDTPARFTNEAYRVLYDAHLPGSTIKGATILTGLDTGVIQPNTEFRDRPLIFYGSPDFRSWSNLGVVDDIEALQRSSNIYMFRLAMRLGGQWDYTPNNRLSYNGEGFSTLSNYFRQFGLGSTTGIDYPYEAQGVLGDDSVKGYEVMHMAIGQYEAYTPMQLVQYVSTIANGGYRIEPHIVKQIHAPTNESKLGPIYISNDPTVLNKVEIKDEYFERVQEGFRRAFQEPGGTAYYKFGDAKYKPAGKTGTAESAIYPGDGTRIDTINLSLVGYAPHDKPEVAFALIVPHLEDTDPHINNDIGRKILDAYFELKEERQKGEPSDSEKEIEENAESEKEEE